MVFFLCILLLLLLEKRALTRSIYCARFVYKWWGMVLIQTSEANLVKKMATFGKKWRRRHGKNEKKKEEKWKRRETFWEDLLLDEDNDASPIVEEDEESEDKDRPKWEDMKTIIKNGLMFGSLSSFSLAEDWGKPKSQTWSKSHNCSRPLC